MYCIKCGAQLHDGAKFCANCGAVIGRTGASATPVIKEEPKVETPKVEIPKVETPKVETPVVETPVVETPKVETPVAEPQKAEEPVVVEKAQPEEQPVTEKQIASAAYQEFHDAEQGDDEAPKKQKKGKKKAGKVIAVIAIILAAVILLGALAGGAYYFVFRRMGLNDVAATYAYVDSNDKGYLCYANGKVIELGKNISSACLTPDKKKVVVVGTDGLVYWTDTKLSEKNKITDLKIAKDEECWVDIDHLTNDFIIIEVEDDRTSLVEKCTYYRYAFEDDKLVELFTDTSNLKSPELDVETPYEFGYSEYVNEVAFVKAEHGEIRVLTPDSNKFEKIATYNNNAEIFFCGVSNDGSTVSWMEFTKDGYSVMVYTDGDDEKVAYGTYENGLSSVDYYVMYSSPKSDICLLLGGEEIMIIKDGETESVKFNGTVAPYLLFTTNGKEFEEDAKAATAFGCYIGVLASDESSFEVYLVDFENADKERLIGGVSLWVAAEDKLVYLDTAQTLYIADVDLKEQELSEKTKIANEVWDVALSTSNVDYIYFMKNYNEIDFTGDLYVYDVKKDEDDKIKSNVYAEDFEVSEDGRYAYYFTSVKKEEGSYVEYGDFNVYDAKRGETQEIDEKVIVYSAWSMLTGYEYDPKCIWYEQYSSIAGDSYKYNVCFYNGRETVEIIDGMTN